MPKRRSSNPRRSKNSRRRNVSKRRNVSRRNVSRRNVSKRRNTRRRNVSKRRNVSRRNVSRRNVSRRNVSRRNTRRRNVSRRNTREQRSSAGGADFGEFPIDSPRTGTATTEATELAGAFGLKENPAWQDMVNNIVLKLSAKESTMAGEMSEGLKTIGEQIMEDYVMDGQEYVENEVTGSLSRDQLERYLNISQYVGRAADKMKVTFTRDAKEKGGCLLGAKFSCQLGMFRNFFWKNIDNQLNTVKEEKSQDNNNKAVISFNCFYKVDHINKMLKKLTEDGELCGPWLVTNGEDNKSHVKEDVNGKFIACDDDDAARILPLDTKGRMLKKDELKNMVDIIDRARSRSEAAEAADGENKEVSLDDENIEGGGLSSHSNLIRPSKIRIDAHNKKKKPSPLYWYRTQEELINYIKKEGIKEKLKEGKEPVTDISAGRGVLIQ